MGLTYFKGRPYYYRYERKYGRVKCRYIASGALAVALAEDDQRIREQTETLRQEKRAADDTERQACQVEQERWRTTQIMLTISLESLGFRRYARNPWKRRSMTTPATTDTDKPGIKKQFRTLARRVERGDPEAVGELRQFATAHPVEMAVQFTYDIARMTRLAITHSEFKKNRSDSDAMFAKMESVIAELVGEKPTLQRLLCAEVVAFAWAEFWVLSSVAAFNKVGTESLERSRRRSAAHRRFMSSLKTLAQIARLEGRPASIFDMFKGS